MDPLKPGWQSSETYITAMTIGGLIAALIVAQFHGDSGTVQMLVGVLAAGLAGHYVYARSSLKAKALDEIVPPKP